MDNKVVLGGALKEALSQYHEKSINKITTIEESVTTVAQNIVNVEQSITENIQALEQDVNDKIQDLQQNTGGEVTNNITNNYIIEDVTNPLTMNPLEYGHFVLSENQTTNVSVGDIINFSTVVDSNMTIENGRISLKGNKTYNISMNMVAQTSRCDIKFKNETTNEYIGKGNTCINTTGNYNFNSSSNVNFIYTPPCDSVVYAEITISDSTSIIYAEYTNLVIQEIRNNPVNQYGGFETEVLFDGMAIDVGEYSLNGSIEGYNYIGIFPYTVTQGRKYELSIFEAVVGDTVDICPYGERWLSILFKENDKFELKTNYTTHNQVNAICKIIGIKGQIPSLLVGGEF